RSVTDVYVDLPGLHHELPEVVVEADVVAGQLERHGLALAWCQRHPRESTKPAYRLFDARRGIVDVELHDLVTCTGTRVLDIGCRGDASVLRPRAGAEL